MSRTLRLVSPLLILLAHQGCGRTPSPRTGQEPSEDEPLLMSEQTSAAGLTALVIQNVTDTSLMLSRGVEIEALELFGTHHESHELEDYSIEASHFFLIENCDQPTNGCLTLESEETMRTIPWTGYYAAPQCQQETPSDYAAPSGRYRFVVTACGGGLRFSGPPFEHVMTSTP